MQPSGQASLVLGIGYLPVGDHVGQLITPSGQGLVDSHHVRQQLPFLTQILAEGPVDEPTGHTSDTAPHRSAGFRRVDLVGQCPVVMEVVERLLAGHRVAAPLTGDRSRCQRRPTERLVLPLQALEELAGIQASLTHRSVLPDAVPDRRLHVDAMLRYLASKTWHVPEHPLPQCTNHMPTAMTGDLPEPVAPSPWVPSPWVMVAGPPGSGGEVIAQALSAIGLALVEPGRRGPDRDRFPIVLTVDGERLAADGDAVLALTDGTWWAPPELPPGWELLPEVAAAAPSIVATLETVLRSRTANDVDAPPAVWYDVRHALLLPFWRRHHGGVRAAVVTWRTPRATVTELQGHGIADMHALALWEASLVGALGGTGGMAVLGVDVDSALADPDRWAVLAARFLADRGFATADDGVERAGAILRASQAVLAGPVVPIGPDDTEHTASSDRLARPLTAVSGVHDRWEPPDDLCVGRWPAALLAATLASHRSAIEATDGWIVTDDAIRDAASAVAALDWTVDRLVEGWASGRLTDGGEPTLPE